MRANEIEGAEVSILKLQLTRRIGVKATRNVALKGGQQVTVSLSARDRVEDLMADDIIQVGRDLFRVVGVVLETGKVYAQPLAGGQPQEIGVPGAAELIYRAGILTGKRSESVEVGSPAFEVSTLVPNDLVSINSGPNYIFRGIGRSGPLFVDPETREVFSTSFSALVMPENFVVVKRTTFVPVRPERS
jgi:hypothetical protein